MIDQSEPEVILIQNKWRVESEESHFFARRTPARAFMGQRRTPSCASSHTEINFGTWARLASEPVMKTKISDRVVRALSEG